MVRSHTPDDSKNKHPSSDRPSLLAARFNHAKIKPHHTKPYRKRHFAALAVVGVFFLVIVLQSGIIIGQSNLKQSTVGPTMPIPPSNKQPTDPTIIKSTYGYSIKFDRNLFSVNATAVDTKGVASVLPASRYNENTTVNSVTISPEPGRLPARLSATRLSLQIGTDTAAFTRLKSRNPTISNEELARQSLPINRPNNFDMRIVSDLPDSLGGLPVQKTVYQYTPLFKGGVAYGTSWHGIVNGYPFVVQLQGLVGSSETPSQFEPLLAGLMFGNNSQVLGARTTANSVVYAAQAVDQKYVSDAISPAVVKIYHVVCGELVVNGRAIKEGCDALTGSGFILSSDGYVATNGHVVVRGAKDVFVGTLISSQLLLSEFLRSLGLSFDEASSLSQRPELLASIIAKVYDVPDSQIYFKNQREATLVALGTVPVELNSVDDAKKIFNFEDNDFIKLAEVIATDYNSKDQYSIQSDPEAGFTASDVALLKIDVENAPLIPLYTGKITQNQKIIVMGFPGDADNSLTDNSELGVSVTNGTVSSIRNAAGGKSTLYQSDADASQGSSGGPAITEDGAVFGLLTYRVGSSQTGNAAKSYARAIGDLVTLADTKNITFDTNSSTQAAWLLGLEYFSQNRFKKALVQFQLVENQYPGHRLATSYIANTTQAIAEGRDIKDSPVAFLFIAGGASFLLLAIIVFVIIQQYGKHQRYRAAHAVGVGYTV